jgi:hypothetical protein
MLRAPALWWLASAFQLGLDHPMNRTLREQVLDHFVFFNVRHLMRVLKK